MSNRFAKDSLILMAGRGLGFCINIITPLVLVRLFSVSEYGEYRQVMLILTTTAMLLPLGMPSSLFYFFPHFPDQKHVFLTRSIMSITVFGGFIAILMWICKTDIAEYLSNPNFIIYAPFLGLTILMLSLSLLIEAVLIVDRKIILSTKIMAFSRVTRAFIIIFCALKGEIVHIIYGLLMLFALKTAGSLVYFRIKYGISLYSFQIKNAYEQLRYAIPLGLGSVFILLSEVTDKFFVSRYLGVESFAIYTIGCFELPFITIFFSSIGDVTLPKIVQLKSENATGEVIKLWHYAIEKSILVGIPLFVFFSSFATEFIVTFFTAKYSESIGIFRIALINVLLEATRYGMITRGYARTGFMFFVSFGGFIIMLPCCYFGIKHFGMIGAICTVIFIKSSIITAELVYSKMILSLQWKRILPFTYIFKIIAISVFSALTTMLVAYPFDDANKWLRFFLVCTIFFSLYAVVSNYFKFWYIQSLPMPSIIKINLSKILR